jgi:hypothetical protein
MRTARLALLVAVAAPWLAWADPPRPIRIRVGQVLVLADAGLLMPPGNSPICDNPRVAVGELTPRGLAFRGVAPGTTLCSASPGAVTNARRVFSVTVGE